MGCSFYYEGCLKDHKAQEEVIELAEQLAGEQGFILLPDSNKKYLAKIGLDSNLLEDGSYTQSSGISDPSCGFDFYGISFYGNPLQKDFGAVTDQFIFHRCQPGSLAYIENREGMIVSLKLDQLRQYSYPDYDEAEFYEGSKCPVLHVDSGGHFRCGGGAKFALLLKLIKLRWMPDLEMSDDYGNCDSIERIIHHHRLAGKFSKKSMSFEDCWEMVEEFTY